MFGFSLNQQDCDCCEPANPTKTIFVDVFLLSSVVIVPSERPACDRPTLAHVEIPGCYILLYHIYLVCYRVTRAYWFGMSSLHVSGALLFVFLCTHKHKLFITLSFHSRPGIQGLLVWHVIPSCFRCPVFCFSMHTQTQTFHHPVISFKTWYQGPFGLACDPFMFQVSCFWFLCTHKHKLFITLSFHSRPGIQGLLVWHVTPSCFRCPVFCFSMHTQTQTFHHSVISFKTWYPGLVGLACHPFMFQVFCFTCTHTNKQTQTFHHSAIPFKTWYQGPFGLACDPFMFQVSCFWFLCTHKHKLFITLSCHSRPGIQGLLVWHVIPSCFRCPVVVSYAHTHKHKLFITLSFHSRPGIQGLLVWHVIPSCFRCPVFCFSMHTQTQTFHHPVIPFKTWYQGPFGLACDPFMFQVSCFWFLCTHKHKLFITLSFHSRPGIQGLLVWHVIPSCFRCPVFCFSMHTQTQTFHHPVMSFKTWYPGLVGLACHPFMFQVFCFLCTHTQTQTVHHPVMSFKTWYPGLIGLACHPFMFQVFCFLLHTNTNFLSLCHYIQDLVSRACWFGMSSLHVSGVLFGFYAHTNTNWSSLCHFIQDLVSRACWFGLSSVHISGVLFLHAHTQTQTVHHSLITFKTRRPGLVFLACQFTMFFCF